ncbi:MAG: hypothetical protein ACRDLF_08470 [Solirubrobacteraceae bacterium]
MRFPAIARIRSARIWLVALLAGAGLAAASPSAQAAEALGVESFFAGNCNATSEAETTGCKKAASPAEEKEKAEKEGYTQAAGHPAFGVTDFKIDTVGTFPNEAPLGVVTHVRTDVGTGVSTNPQAVSMCSKKEFDATEVAPGFFTAPECKAGTGEGGTEIGVNKVVVYLGPEGGDLPLEGTVYNIEPPTGFASDFGVALPLPKPLTELLFKKPTPQLYAHTEIDGDVEWAGDYHDYYEINVNPTLPLISSRLILKGSIGNTKNGGFITNPSSCVGPGPATTNTVTLTSKEGQKAAKTYTTPLGTEGCLGEGLFTAPPFAPKLSLEPETTRSDQPDGVTTDLKLPHDPSPEGIDSSQLRNATVTLPEGMTLNPSAAHGLEACTPAQIGIGTRNEVKCPLGAKLGTVTLVVPDLPATEPLRGSLYLGGPESGPITGPPYTMYIDAESARYGISVRLKGTVVPNEATGRVTVSFTDNPQQPFSDAILHLDGGPLAPLANPLACGPASTEATLTPYTGTAAQSPLVTPFVVDSNGSGGPCSTPLPFTLAQSTANEPATAGASTSFAFTLTRPAGQQYLAQVKTVLPAGLVGRIPAASLCGEAQIAEAQAGTGGCPASSRIGSATVLAGAGPAPYQFNGSFYLTGPYGGAPYGLVFVVPAAAGPFSLGNVVTRATLNVEPYTARVVVAGSVPTIFKGIPLRMQSLTIEANRQNFMLNPTTCATLQTESTLTGLTTLGSNTFTTQSVATPLTTEECTKLQFKPSLTAFTGAKTSKANGASLEVKITQGSGQANIQKVITTLPKQLVSRLTTLQKACPAATFEVNPPGGCSKEAQVGTATATTPVLPGTLTGVDYFVSHGGEAFPDLDVILRGDGVTVILVGHTHITNGITTTTFESLPDVPVSSFALTLPTASNSALTANGNVCTANLTMPTTIVAQNGATVTQKTKISPTKCPVEIVKHRTSGATAILTVQTPAAGRISGSGTDLKLVRRQVGKATRTTIKVPLTRTGREVLRKFRRLRIKVRVGFKPKKGSTSKASATVTFRA